MWPVWIAAIPTSADIPVSRDFPDASQFMALCRVQRQTDEKGLSAWSSGFGASGNPTKMQLRLQKKLSIVLGLLFTMKESETLIIFDDQRVEIPVLNAQLNEWKKHKNEVLGSKQWKFYVPTSDYRISQQIPAVVTSQATWTGPFHLLYFPNLSLEVPKISEWAKIEQAQLGSLTSLLGVNIDKNHRKGTHVHVYTQIYSPRMFDLFAVYTVGSAHNMMGLMSTLDSFDFAKSEGGVWDLGVDNVAKITQKEFVSRVMLHNAARSSFFLNGKYYFNPRLNLLRHIEGKTVDFVTGYLEDIIGIDVEVEKDLIEDFIQGDDYDSDGASDDESSGEDLNSPERNQPSPGSEVASSTQVVTPPTVVEKEKKKKKAPDEEEKEATNAVPLNDFFG